MTGAEVAVDLVRALAWPVTAVVLIFGLRRLLESRLAEVEGFGFRAKFDRLAEETLRSVSAVSEEDTVEEVGGAESAPLPVRMGAKLIDRAKRDPSGAILAAFQLVVDDLVRRLQEDGFSSSSTYEGGLELALIARDRGIITDSSVEAMRTLQTLRNVVVHESKETTTAEAMEFMSIADSVLFSFTRRPSRSTTKFRVRDGSEVLVENAFASAAFRKIATLVADDLGEARLLQEIGPPLVADSPNLVTRPDRARRVAPHLDLWHTSQLDQAVFIEMANQLAEIDSKRKLVMEPQP